MAIDIRIEDEQGNLWRSPEHSTHPGNAWCINWLLSSVDVSDTICLKFIDRYGDTVFNRAQATILLEELATAQSKISDEALASAAQRRREKNRHFDIPDEPVAHPSAAEINTFVTHLREMIALSIMTPHTFVKFVGD